MCLLDGVLVRVQVPRWVVHQRLVFASSFSGSGAPNHAPPTMGIAIPLLSIAMAIPLRLRQRMARSKAQDPFHQFEWPEADRADNSVVDMPIPLATLILRQVFVVPAGAKCAMLFCLI